MAHEDSSGYIDVTWRMRTRDMAVLPAQPVDARFIIITGGVPIPDKRGCYLARFIPESKHKAQILAYIDFAGKVFACRAFMHDAPTGNPWAYLMYQKPRTDPAFDERHMYIVRSYDDAHEEVAGEVVGDLTAVCQFTVRWGGEVLLNAMPLDYNQGMAAAFLILSSFGAQVEGPASISSIEGPAFHANTLTASPAPGMEPAADGAAGACPASPLSATPSMPTPSVPSGSVVTEPPSTTPSGHGTSSVPGYTAAEPPAASVCPASVAGLSAAPPIAGAPSAPAPSGPMTPATAMQGTGSREYVDWPSVRRVLREHEFFEALGLIAQLERSYRSGERKVTAPVQVFLENLRAADVADLTRERLEAMVPVEGAEVSATLALTLRYSGLYFINYVIRKGADVLDDGMWLRGAETSRARRALLALESCINRAELVYRRIDGAEPCLTYDFATCASLDQGLFGKAAASLESPAGAPVGLDRWETNYAFARKAEALRLPYRLLYEFHTSADLDMIGVRVVCPSAEDVSFVGVDPTGRQVVPKPMSWRNRLVAQYAASLAVRVAALGFAVNDGIRQVAVNCVELGRSERTVVSVVFDRDWFAGHLTRLTPNVPAVPATDLPSCTIAMPAIDLVEASGGVVDVQVDGSLGTLNAPTFRFGAGPFTSPDDDDIDTDHRPLTPWGMELLHVDRVSDLGIYEQAERLKAGGMVTRALENEGSHAAVRELETQLEKMEDEKGREVCEGLLREFRAGRLDDSSYLEVKEAFSDPFGYKAYMVKAEEMSKRGDPAVVDVLRETVDMMRRRDMPEDTTDVCYRYFDSYADRCLYQKYCRDDAVGRIVKPLNDTLYFFQDALAQTLTMSATGADDGIRCAKGCVRLSPGNAGAYMRLARSYFVIGDYEHELEMCVRALQYVWQRSELEVILYWSAFALWRLGRHELSAACYRQCLQIDGRVSGQARLELDELESQYKGLKRQSPQEDARLLKEQGIFDVERVHENIDYLLECAHAGAEAGSYRLARVLIRSAMPLGHDDALSPLALSFETDPHATDLAAGSDPSK